MITPYRSYKNFGDMISCLERTAGDLFAWFNNNGLKANADKCHLLLGTKEKLKANIAHQARKASKALDHAI